MIRFEVPGEPVAQGRPRVVQTAAGPRGIDPRKSRSYKATVRLFAAHAYHDTPLEGPLMVYVDIYRQIQRTGSKKLKAAKLAGDVRPVVKPDIDNVFKAVTDACTGVIWKDDNQIVSTTINKYYSDRPRVAVRVTEIRGENHAGESTNRN